VFGELQLLDYLADRERLGPSPQ